MKTLFKPFEAWVIAWRYQNDFTRARWKLTLVYAVLIFLVLSIFSWGVYFSAERFFAQTSTQFDTSWQEHIQLETKNHKVTVLEWQRNPRNFLSRQHYLDFQESIRSQLKKLLLLWGGFITIFSAFLSYYLAGKTLAPIEVKMHQKNEFLADISHEIKNPLSALQTAAEVALQHPQWTEAEQKDFLQDFVTEIKRLTRLTEDLLFLQKNRTPPQKFDSVDFLKVVKESIRRIAPLQKEKNIKITSNFPKKKVQMSGIEKELEKLCFNLLHNAIKFTPEKSTLKLKLYTQQNQLYFEVKDAGPGLSPQDQAQIFDRFFKVDSARSFDYQGAGLGLSIVRKIIRTHQGEITVKSHPGMGTTFVVSFPLRK